MSPVATRRFILAVLLHGTLAQGADADEVRLGRETALRHCQTCHLLPKPELLDKETWLKGALPHMALWLGIAKPNLAARPDGPRLASATVFPAAPVISEKEWRALHAYYADGAPSEPHVPTNKPVSEFGLSLFRVRTLQTTSQSPYTSLVCVDAANRRLWVGDAQEKTLKALRPDGTLIHTIPVDSAPVAVTFEPTGLIVTLIGRMRPSDELAGQVWSVSLDSGVPETRPLLRKLPRTAHTTVADLQGDGRADLIVSGFGHRLGGLSWFENEGNDRYSEHVLLTGAGTLRTHVHDWDGDGRPDILVLRAQAREGVEIFFNRGTYFAETPVLQFSPAHGGAAWQVVDLDRDGELDLLIANGDNGDYPSKPKAYHGLRAYRGDGHGRFSETWFHPLPGAYGVFAADFDGDEDLDIAAISWYPDYEHSPDEGFVYLRNEGGNRYHPFVVPESRLGRWLVMDVGDLDGDGDLDIVLGSFPEGPGTTLVPEALRNRWAARRISVMILENRSRRPVLPETRTTNAWTR